MTKSRAPVKPVNKSTSTVAKQADAEKQRKATSRAALKAAKQAEAPASASAPVAVPPVSRETPESVRHQRNLDAARIEADATGMAFEEACESMGVNPETGAPVEQTKTRYTGPMLVLRDAAKHYVRGANGNPHCGDFIAQTFASMKREDVVAAIIRIMKYESNPYAHLNPGQQSMNLRNRLRGAMKNGLVTEAEVLAGVRGE